LAQEVARIIKEEREEVMIVAQWEVTAALKQFGIIPHKSVLPKPDIYLDSEQVCAEAAEVFRKHNIWQVIPVAQPFLQIIKCKSLIKQSGFSVLSRKIHWIGFYKKSLQPWTQGPLKTLWYSIKQTLSSSKGTHILLFSKKR
jgi:hypothetical protein